MKKQRDNLTKQNVRNLDNIQSPVKRNVKMILRGALCSHVKMRVHCFYHKGKPCGHFICDGCGLYWDKSDSD